MNVLQIISGILNSNKDDKMAADMTHLLDDFPTDFTFLVGGKEVGAHKSRLAAHPVFEMMIFGAGDEGTGAGVNWVKVSK